MPCPYCREYYVTILSAQEIFGLKLSSAEELDVLPGVPVADLESSGGRDITFCMTGGVVKDARDLRGVVRDV